MNRKRIFATVLPTSPPGEVRRYLDHGRRHRPACYYSGCARAHRTVIPFQFDLRNAHPAASTGASRHALFVASIRYVRVSMYLR